MKYSKSAIGLLTREYRSVLKKCLLINLGLFALGAATPANAVETYEDYNGDLGALRIINDTVEKTDEVIFRNNKSTSHGAGLYSKATTAGTESGATFNGNVTFNNNEVVSTASSGSGAGAFVSGGNVSFLGSNNSFTNNHMNATIDSSRQYKVGGGAVANQSYWDESTHAPIDATMVIGTANSTNTFSDNTSSTNGGAIMNRAVDTDGDARMTIDGASTFTNNTAAINGGAIYNVGMGEEIEVGGDWVLKERNFFTQNGSATFNGNQAGARGGAVYNAGVMTLKDAIFTSNRTTTDYSNGLIPSQGGAIYNTGADDLADDFTENGKLTINNATFGDKNDASKGNSAIQGGAIANSADETSFGYMGEITLNNTNFYNNVARADSDASDGYSSSMGGAIWNDDGNITVNGNTEFEGNKAEGYASMGGAIRNGYGDITFNDEATFNSNTSEKTINAGNGAQGGAINNEGTMTFKKTASFEGNEAINSVGAGSGLTYLSKGGAIYNESYGMPAAITFEKGATFTENSADLGGAIFNMDGVINLTDASFTNNTANNDGGAIFNMDTVNIKAVNSDVVFEKNTANGVANDLYNAGIVNLNAAEGKEIAFKSGIDGEGRNDGSNLYVKGAGTLLLDSNVARNRINIIEASTIKLGENGSIDNTSMIYNYHSGATLDLRNGKTDTIKFTSLTSAINVYVDADTNGNLDKIGDQYGNFAGAADKKNLQGIQISSLQDNLNLDTTGYTVTEAAKSSLGAYYDNIEYDSANNKITAKKAGYADLIGIWEDGNYIKAYDVADTANTSVAANLKALDDQVFANAGDIATNAENIAANTANISTNTANIATNAENIAANTTAIAGKLTGSKIAYSAEAEEGDTYYNAKTINDTFATKTALNTTDGKVSALEGIVGKEAAGDDPATGLVKKVADNATAIANKFDTSKIYTTSESAPSTDVADGYVYSVAKADATFATKTALGTKLDTDTFNGYLVGGEGTDKNDIKGSALQAASVARAKLATDVTSSLGLADSSVQNVTIAGEGGYLTAAKSDNTVTITANKIAKTNLADGLSGEITASTTKLTGMTDDTVQASINTAVAGSVKYTNIPTAELPNRKAIVLNNHDIILGTDTEGHTYNLAMLSKWDVADFGSNQIHMNLNSKGGVATLNDEQVVLTDQLLNKVVAADGNIVMTESDVTADEDGIAHKKYTFSTKPNLNATSLTLTSTETAKAALTMNGTSVNSIDQVEGATAGNNVLASKATVNKAVTDSILMDSASANIYKDVMAEDKYAEKAVSAGALKQIALQVGTNMQADQLGWNINVKPSDANSFSQKLGKSEAVDLYDSLTGTNRTVIGALNKAGDAIGDMNFTSAKIEGVKNATDLSTAVRALDTQAKNIADNAVFYTKIPTAELPNRKAIVLDNHDIILGTDTEGHTYNLAMLSKWDVADFGSNQIHMNLNSKGGVATLNDEQVVLTDQLLNKVVAADGNIVMTESDVAADVDGIAHKKYTFSTKPNLNATSLTLTSTETANAALTMNGTSVNSIDQVDGATAGNNVLASKATVNKAVTDSILMANASPNIYKDVMAEDKYAEKAVSAGALKQIALQVGTNMKADQLGWDINVAPTKDGSFASSLKGSFYEGLTGTNRTVIGALNKAGDEIAANTDRFEDRKDGETVIGKKTVVESIQDALKNPKQDIVADDITANTLTLGESDKVTGTSGTNAAAIKLNDDDMPYVDAGSEATLATTASLNQAVNNVLTFAGQTFNAKQQWLDGFTGISSSDEKGQQHAFETSFAGTYNILEDKDGVKTTNMNLAKAFKNIDSNMGKIHGLVGEDGAVVSSDAQKIVSTTGKHSNLAKGTSVEMHLVSLDNTIGDRSTISNEKGSNSYALTARTNVADVLSDIASQIGKAGDLTSTINGVALTNTVNTNISAVNSKLGNVSTLDGAKIDAVKTSTNAIDAILALDGYLNIDTAGWAEYKVLHADGTYSTPAADNIGDAVKFLARNGMNATDDQTISGNKNFTGTTTLAKLAMGSTIVEGIDTTVKADSGNLVTSGAVSTALEPYAKTADVIATSALATYGTTVLDDTKNEVYTAKSIKGALDKAGTAIQDIDVKKGDAISVTVDDATRKATITYTDADTTYTQGNGVAISGSNVISVKLAATGSGLAVDEAGLKVSGLTDDHIAANAGIAQSKIAGLTDDLAKKANVADYKIKTASDEFTVADGQLSVNSIAADKISGLAAVAKSGNFDDLTVGNGAIKTKMIKNGAVTYSKLDSDVQASLDLADSSLQGIAKKSEDYITVNGNNKLKVGKIKVSNIDDTAFGNIVANGTNLVKSGTIYSYFQDYAKLGAAANFSSLTLGTAAAGETLQQATAISDGTALSLDNQHQPATYRSTLATNATVVNTINAALAGGDGIDGKDHTWTGNNVFEKEVKFNKGIDVAEGNVTVKKGDINVIEGKVTSKAVDTKSLTLGSTEVKWINDGKTIVTGGGSGVVLATAATVMNSAENAKFNASATEADIEALGGAKTIHNAIVNTANAVDEVNAKVGDIDFTGANNIHNTAGNAKPTLTDAVNQLDKAIGKVADITAGYAKTVTESGSSNPADIATAINNVATAAAKADGTLNFNQKFTTSDGETVADDGSNKATNLTDAINNVAKNAAAAIENAVGDVRAEIHGDTGDHKEVKLGNLAETVIVGKSQTDTSGSEPETEIIAGMGIDTVGREVEIAAVNENSEVGADFDAKNEKVTVSAGNKTGNTTGMEIDNKGQSITMTSSDADHITTGMEISNKSGTRTVTLGTKTKNASGEELSHYTLEVDGEKQTTTIGSGDGKEVVIGEGTVLADKSVTVGDMADKGVKLDATDGSITSTGDANIGGKATAKTFANTNNTFSVDENGNLKAKVIDGQTLAVHGDSWLKDVHVSNNLSVKGTATGKEVVAQEGLTLAGTRVSAIDTNGSKVSADVAQATRKATLATAETVYAGAENAKFTPAEGETGVTKAATTLHDAIAALDDAMGTMVLNTENKNFVQRDESGEIVIDETTGKPVALTNATDALNALDAVVGNINDLDVSKGNLHASNKDVASHLSALDKRLGGIKDLGTNSTLAHTNLATTASTAEDGITASDHFNSLDVAMGNRTNYKNNSGSNGYVAQNDGSKDLTTMISEVASNIGKAGDITSTNQISAQQTVNANLSSLDAAIGNVDALSEELGATDLTSAINNLNTKVNESNGAFSKAINQLDMDHRKLRHDFEAGMAGQAALSALVPNAKASGNTQLAVGTGAYKGHTAAAVGGFHWFTDNLLFNAGVAWDNNEATGRMGITYSW